MKKQRLVSKQLKESYEHVLDHEEEFFNFTFHFVRLLKYKGCDNLASIVVSAIDLFRLFKTPLRMGLAKFIALDMKTRKEPKPYEMGDHSITSNSTSSGPIENNYNHKTHPGSFQEEDGSER